MDDENLKRCAYEEDIMDMAMLRCSNRRHGMTESEDLDSMLHEKEKDLELAAKIGKMLLERNEHLERRNEILEERMNSTSDQVIQLKHELQMKRELLRVFNENDYGEEGHNPSRRNSEKANYNHLQRRVRSLEEENTALKLDISQLKAITIVLKEKEEQMVAEFLRQLAMTKRQAKVVSNELQEKQDECEKQEQKISCLLKEIKEKSKHEQQLQEENVSLTAKLQVMQGIQSDLAQEMLDLQERYAEVLTMLTNAKQELKEAQERQYEARFSTSSLAGDSLNDSLASELEASDSGYSWHKNASFNPLPQKESVQNEIRQTDTSDQQLELTETESGHKQVEEHTVIAIEKAKMIMKGIEAALESAEYSQGSLFEHGRIGVPGTPGSKDLENAIQRLSHSPVDVQKTNSANEINQKKKRTNLMLVVPVEGSKALAHWKELATPSGIDRRSWQKLPGINVKSEFSSLQSPVLEKRLNLSSLLGQMTHHESWMTHKQNDDSSKSRPIQSDESSKSKLGLTERCLGLIGGGWLASMEKSKSNVDMSFGMKNLSQLGSLEDINIAMDGVMMRSELQMKK